MQGGDIMRKLMLFTIGFTLACMIGTYFFSTWCWGLFALGLICFGVAVILRKKWCFLPIAVVSLGLCVGLCWFGGYRYLYLSPAVSADGNELQITAQIMDYGVSADYGLTVKGRITLEGRSYPSILYLKHNYDLKPGDKVTGKFRLRMTHDGLQGDTYHRSNGTFLLAYSLDDCVCQANEEQSIRYFPAILRKAIAKQLDTCFSEETAAFVKALLLGDRSGIEYETRTAFKVSGISHIIAVSGMHVSILYSVIFLIAGRKRLITVAIGIPILIVFAAVTGFTPSVTRACVMQILFMIADYILKEYDPPTALSASVLLMLVVNPISVSSVSLQLSVGCMAGIILLYPGIQKWICDFSFWRSWKGKNLKVRFRNWIASGVAVTFSSMFFTTPFVAYYFRSVSLIGVLTNLATLWAVSWIFYGAMVVCLISIVWIQGATILAGLVSWLIQYVLLVSKAFSSIPLAAVYTKSGFIVGWLVLCYVLVLGFLIWKKRRPYLLICTILCSLSAALLLSWLVPMTANSRVTVLNVGQGQSLILQSNGKSFLVDCGGDDPENAADLATETLLSMGIYRLDGIILTHYDSDHAAGIPYLMSRMSADYVYLPEPCEDEDIKRSILESAGNAAVFVQEDIHLAWEQTTLSIFSPVFQFDDNESGLSVLFRGENCDILITGDLGITGENKLVVDKGIPKLTALVAGHHGSSYSTGGSLLAATEPDYVFISVGENNRYGHPTQQVLERLEQYGCTVYRTDLDGTIVFRR